LALRFITVACILFVLEIIFLSKDLNYIFGNGQDDTLSIEFYDSHSRVITPQGVTKVLKASKISQFQDYKLFIDPFLTIYDHNRTKTISAKNAKLIDKLNSIELKYSVTMEVNRTIFTTENLEYNLVTQVAKNSSPYRLKNLDIEAYGNNLYFDMKNSTIRSEMIDYNLYLKE
jgi:LPS export ABC transporter protein LptC